LQKSKGVTDIDSIRSGRQFEMLTGYHKSTRETGRTRLEIAWFRVFRRFPIAQFEIAMLTCSKHSACLFEVFLGHEDRHLAKAVDCESVNCTDRLPMRPRNGIRGDQGGDVAPLWRHLP
jgi:hypothetical protein